MAEKSGIEMIKEILKKMSHLEEQIKVLDRNIKQIANSAKLSELMESAKNTPLKNWAAAAENTSEQKGFKNFKFESANAKNTGVAAKKRQSGFMVKGRMMVNSEKGKTVPLPSVFVKIFDDQDTLIRETKTNRAGQWMAKLKPGRYVALFEGKFNGKDLVPINRKFIVPDMLPEGEDHIEII